MKASDCAAATMNSTSPDRVAACTKLCQADLGPSDLEGKDLALAYLFEYLIGNLDFSFNGLHNTELLATTDGRVLPVAYDFDFSGAVNTSYAVPPPDYGVPNVRTRKFMGY